MTAMRVYISGPISGRPSLNAPAFFAAAAALRQAGHSAINPHDVCRSIKATEWADCPQRRTKCD